VLVAAVTLLVPLVLGHGVVGMIRYVDMPVPCFMVLGVYGRHPWMDRLTLLSFLPLMGYPAYTFSHNYGPY
jgi:hypothetical protein